METTVSEYLTERDRWRAVSTATGPGDRAAAEAGVRAAYRRAGLAVPDRMLWVDSPLAAVRVLRAESAAGASVREALRTTPMAAERARLRAELGAAGFAERWRATGADLWEVTTTVIDRARAGVIEDSATERRERTAVRLLLLGELESRRCWRLAGGYCRGRGRLRKG